MMGSKQCFQDDQVQTVSDYKYQVNIPTNRQKRHTLSKMFQQSLKLLLKKTSPNIGNFYGILNTCVCHLVCPPIIFYRNVLTITFCQNGCPHQNVKRYCRPNFDHCTLNIMYLGQFTTLLLIFCSKWENTVTSHEPLTDMIYKYRICLCNFVFIYRILKLYQILYSQTV